MIILLVSLLLPSWALSWHEGLRLSISGSILQNKTHGTTESNYTNLYAGSPDAAGKLKTSIQPNKKKRNVIALRAGIFFLDDSGFSLGFNYLRDLSSSQFTSESKDFIFPNPNSRSDFPMDYRIQTIAESKLHHALELEPAIKLSKVFDIFLRVAFHLMRADIRTLSSLNSGNLWGPVIINESDTNKKILGFSYGLGSMYKFSKDFFITISGQWLKYSPIEIQASSLQSGPDEIDLINEQKITFAEYRSEIGLGVEF